MSEAAAPTPRPFSALLHAQRVWDSELPSFDPATAPPSPSPSSTAGSRTPWPPGSRSRTR